VAGTIYATSADLRLPDAVKASIGTTNIDAALAEASSLIDSYIGKQFDLPLSAVPLEVKSAACNLAAFMALQGRGFNPGSVDAETLRMSFEDARSWLRDVSTGKATLAYPAGIDVEGTNPQSTPFVYSPAQGSIGLSGGGFRGKDTDASVSVGTVGRPRSRGW